MNTTEVHSFKRCGIWLDYKIEAGEVQEVAEYVATDLGRFDGYMEEAFYKILKTIIEEPTDKLAQERVERESRVGMSLSKLIQWSGNKKERWVIINQILRMNPPSTYRDLLKNAYAEECYDIYFSIIKASSDLNDEM